MKQTALLTFLAVSILIILLACPLSPAGDSESEDEEECTAGSYEPNESIDSCYDLGTVKENDPEVSYTARIAPQIDKDFYRLYAEEGSSICLLMTMDCRIEIRLVPPTGKDYDLYLYDDAGTLLSSSTASGDTEESITYDWGLCSTDDSWYFRIEVRPLAGAWDCSNYTLNIKMLSI